MLENEYKYFEENLPKLLKKHLGKFLVINDTEVKGAFDGASEAFIFASKQFKLGDFIIQECLPEKELQQTFYSNNVIFP